MVDSGELILLQISDEGTCGLNGPETGGGNFAALCRNMLDSNKTSGTSGGSHGLGKAVLWRMSALNTVLFCSNLTEPLDGETQLRFIGRSDLAWHELPAKSLRERDAVGAIEPARPGRIVSIWDNRALAKDLLIDRGEAPGTTVNVVAFHDPSADEVPTPAQLAESLETALARHFWPALSSERFKATVDVADGQTIVRSAKVDVSTLQPAYADLMEKNRRDDLADTLTTAEDVVRVRVELHVPPRRAEPDSHPAFDHRAVLLIEHAPGRRCIPICRVLPHVSRSRDGCEDARPAPCCGRRQSIPCSSAVRRGSQLRPRRPTRRSLSPGRPAARTQHLGGHREAQPGIWPRGWGCARASFEAAIHQAVRDVLLPSVEDRPDGPRDLAELFRITDPPPPPPRAPRLMVEGSEVVDGAWQIEATIRRKDVDRELIGRPQLVFNGETGRGSPVRWAKVTPLKNCTLDAAGHLVISAGVRTARFKAVTDPTSHPISAKHSSVSVDFRPIAAGGKG